MSAARQTVAGIALALVAVCGIVLALAMRDPAADSDRSRIESLPVQVAASAPAQAPATAAAANATRADNGAPTPSDPPVVTVEDVLQAGADGSPDAIGVLLAGVESADAVVVAESTNALVGRGAIGALPTLIDQDVLGRPWAAPSIIDALGRLSAVAAPEQRAEAVDRLIALMHEEKRRGAQESLGNLIQIYEALGQTGDPRAVEPLEQELIDRGVPTAPKVVIVQALVALRATRSTAVLERVHSELAAASLSTGFEAELQRDLLAAIRDALVQLS